MYGLAQAATLCTKLRNISIEVYVLSAENFFQEVLSGAGRTLRKFKLRLDWEYHNLDPDFDFEPPSMLLEQSYLNPVSRFTGNLHRIEIETDYVLSFGDIAKANPNLRCAIIYCNTFHPYFNPEYAFYDKWLANTVKAFLDNCPQIEDIIISSQYIAHFRPWSKKSRELLSKFPRKFTRVSALDDVCSSQRPTRNVRVRVGVTIYM